MTQEQLREFFESKDFNVHLWDEEDNGIINAEVEKWTGGGVDMIMLLRPFCVQAFEKHVNDFNVDEEIELHRQDPKYKADFTIREALDDFTDFHNHLKQILSDLKNKIDGTEI